MCLCGKNTGDFCSECSPTSNYNYYYAENCDSCDDTTPKCRKTIDAKCVINNQNLDFLGVMADDKVDLQTLLISINNALKSLSDANCMEYTRKMNPDTGVASYEHKLNFECIAQTVCPFCNE